MEREFIECVYTGEVDEQGLPHGKGKLVYRAVRRDDDRFDQDGDLRYEGEFVHGMRHGMGSLCKATLLKNPVEPYEWYQEDEYDCGRLVRPAHPDGSYKPFIVCWMITFEGQWENDVPGKPKRDYKSEYPDERCLQRAAATSLSSIVSLPFTHK